MSFFIISRAQLKESHLLRTGLMFLFFALLFCVQWHRLIWGNEIPMDGNTLRFFYPSWSIGKRLLLSGQSLLWDPYRNMGQPFLAHPQNQILYPFRLLVIPFGFLNYVRLFVFFHSCILGWFTYRLVRYWECDRFTAMAATTMMLMGGFLVSRIPDQSDVAAYCWLPAILYFYSKHKSLALGLCLSMQWLSGFPPFVILTLLFLSFSAVTGLERQKSLACLGQAFLFFLGLVAVQWIPFLELFMNSMRPVIFDPKAMLEYSIHPLELVRGFFVPSFLHVFFPLKETSDPAVVGFFLGPTQMGLFIVGLFGLQRKLKYLALATFVGAFMALGKFNGVYPHLPLIGLFRFPAQCGLFGRR